jgi:dolichol-phosphate mannosyltransferase
LDRGDEPVALLRPEGDRWRLEDLEDELEVLPVDLQSRDEVIECVERVAPEVIFHLAAYGAYSWQTDLDTMLAVNVRATDALLEGARRVGARVIQSGSSSEYGFSSRPTSELDPVEPNSHYAVTKVAATHLCRLAHIQHETPALTLRLYSVYGPWEEPGRLLPTLVDHALEGTYPPLVSPETARDFVWAADVCEAFVRAAAPETAADGRVLNIASGRQTTIGTLVDETRRTFEIALEPSWGTMAQRAWDSQTWVGDPTAAAEAIGWQASTSLASGLQQMGEWMVADPERRRRYGRDRASQV